MCLIYNDEDERRQVMTQFIQSRLDGNELVEHYVDSPTPEDLKQTMSDAGATLPDELDGRQYSFLEADKVYCPDGTFKVDRMLDTVAQTYSRAVRERYVGARLTGEMTWSRKGYPGSENLVEYDSRLNILARTVPNTVICQYEAGRFDGATLYGILSVHPMMIVRGQVLRNPYYIEPEVFLANMATGSRA